MFPLQVRVLFSKGSFISIFASDPHIIIKAINQNLNSVLRDSNINGHDYMRNIVHLPVFLNSRGLSSARRMCAAAGTNTGSMSTSTAANGEAAEGKVPLTIGVGLPVGLPVDQSRKQTSALCLCVPGWHEELDRKLSQHSLGELTKFGSRSTLTRRVRYVCVCVWVCK